MKCRVCDSPINAFMSFGRMPIANAFLTADEIEDEYFYELAPAMCGNCGMFQLMEQPTPERLFHNEYPFYTGTSQYMDAHFEAWAKELPPGFVVEIGSNDGTFLRHIKAAGHECVGFEPAKNMAQAARRIGLDVINSFFGKQAEAADVIVAANTICHIPDLNQLAEDVAFGLRPGGIFQFEEPYLLDMLNRGSFDQIYDEHVFMFSLRNVARAFAPHGLRLIDCSPQEVHGGSMRYTLAKQGNISLAVNLWTFAENICRLEDEETWQRFAKECEYKRDHLYKLLAGLTGRIVGYGATSKSTTVLNYCGIGPEIEFIADTTPAKQGKLSPGMHIPVRPYEEFTKRYPDYAVLFAWNHAKEIKAKEKGYTGQWIGYVPVVGVTDLAEKVADLEDSLLRRLG